MPYVSDGSGKVENWSSEISKELKAGRPRLSRLREAVRATPNRFQTHSDKFGFDGSSIKRRIDQGVDRKRLQERLELEATMLLTFPRLLFFTIVFTIFVVSFELEHSPVETAAVHQSLRSRFKLDQEFLGLRQIPDFLKFLGSFATMAEQLSPLSPYHWCADHDTEFLPPVDGKPVNRIWCRNRTETYDLHYGTLSMSSRMLCGVDSLQCSVCSLSTCESNSCGGAWTCSSACNGVCCSSTCSSTCNGGCGSNNCNSNYGCGANPNQCCSSSSSCQGGCNIQCNGACSPTCNGACNSTCTPASCNATGNARRLTRQKNAHAPRQLEIDFEMLAPRLAAKRAADATEEDQEPQSISHMTGVVGFAVNGVLLVGQHFHQGKAARVAWHFDDCGGHGDNSGHYHYHFPPSCLLDLLDADGPSRADWWSQDQPLRYWPTKARPSPLLGFALDGVPIYGPYGQDGHLVKSSDLDRCNGLRSIDEQGRVSYRYIWRESAPFLPLCFRGKILSLPSLENIGKPLCPVNGEQPSQTLAILASVASISSGETQRWRFKASGCPDHRYFQGAMLVESVSPQLELNGSGADVRRKLQATNGCQSCDTVPAGRPWSIVDVFNPCSAAFGDGCRANCFVEPPDLYNRWHPFTLRTASLIPPLVCQTRYLPEECDSDFVRAYNKQTTTPGNRVPLDAPKNGSILRCRSNKHQSSLHLGWPPLRQKSRDPRYCIILETSLVRAAKDWEWLDDMTDTISLHTFIYTPGRGTITLLEATLVNSDSGNLETQYHMKDYIDMKDEDHFIAWNILICIFIVLNVVRLVLLVREASNRSISHRHRVFGDIFVHVVICCFSLTCMIRRHTDTNVYQSFGEIIDAHLGVLEATGDGVDIVDAVRNVVTKYTTTVDEITSITNVEATMKVIAYFIIIFYILRSIASLAVHPKMGIILETLVNAADHLIHFLIIFAALFLSLAWLAFWSLGGYSEVFGTFPRSCFSCFQMLVGEFPFEETMKETYLHVVWYVVFTVLVYLVSLNVVLAVIVESLHRAMQRHQGTSARSIWLDVWSLIHFRMKARAHRWPLQTEILPHLRMRTQLPSFLTASELVESRVVRFESASDATALLHFYYSIIGPGLFGDGVAEELFNERAQKEIQKSVVVGFGLTQADLPLLMIATVRIQSFFRMVKAKKALRRRNGSKGSNGFGHTGSLTKTDRGSLLRSSVDFSYTGSLPKTDRGSLSRNAPTNGVSCWTAKEVVTWASYVALPREVCEALEFHAIDGQVLLSITEADLQHGLGIKQFGYRRRVAQAIASIGSSTLPSFIEQFQDVSREGCEGGDLEAETYNRLSPTRTPTYLGTVEYKGNEGYRSEGYEVCRI